MSGLWELHAMYSYYVCRCRILGLEGGAESKCALLLRQVLVPTAVQPLSAEQLPVQGNIAHEQGAPAEVPPKLSTWSQVKVMCS